MSQEFEMTSATGALVRGTVEPGFEPVAQAFAENFDLNGEVGAGLCIYRHGSPVVDLRGGTKPSEGGVYDDQTLQLVFSTTKGAAAMCLHRLADAGLIDVDAPVATYWPEFAAAGKAAVTVRQLAAHQAGLIDTVGHMSLAEALSWDLVCDRLASTEPIWVPGEAHGYHAVTFGWLIGELVRRVDGRSLGAYFADEIARPLGLEFWIGTPEEIHPRVTPIIGFDGLPGMEPSDGAVSAENTSPPTLVEMLNRVLGTDNLLGRALAAPGGAFADDRVWNDPAVLSAELPAANGVTNASSLARLYAACIGEIDGFRVLGEAALARAIQPQTSGPDKVLMFPSSFGLGFMLDSPFIPVGGPGAFGHYGAGGSVGWANPSNGLAFGYVMNKMQLGLAGDPRTANLLRALGESIANL
jgi:CubicO group peptidase (beta-lactamase class C family)